MQAFSRKIAAIAQWNFLKSHAESAADIFNNISDGLQRPADFILLAVFLVVDGNRHTDCAPDDHSDAHAPCKHSAAHKITSLRFTQKNYLFSPKRQILVFYPQKADRIGRET